jgi:hypothetical protein
MVVPGDSNIVVTLLKNLVKAAASVGIGRSKRLPNAETLLFHMAIGHLGDTAHAAEAYAFLARMLLALQAMNNGSRKAIRLVKL